MRIIFMGTPDFAAESLEALIKGGYDIAGVFCNPDKPKGRGHRLQPPSVKLTAEKYGLTVYQPPRLNDEAQAEIKRLNPDLIVVVAYGKLLPKTVLDIPPLGCINVHGSLLPKYRGAAPIQWAVINGDKITGISTMYMAEGMDTGDVILKAETEIAKDETSGELFDRLMVLGAETLLKTLELVEKGTAPRIPQDDSRAVPAPMLKKQDGEIDWSRSAEEVSSLVRGMNPWPCAYTELEGKKLKVLRAEPAGGSGTPGILWVKDKYPYVYCGEGSVKLAEIQPENGKRMDGKSFLLGHPIKKDTMLG